jgi:hypothetical protein
LTALREGGDRYGPDYGNSLSECPDSLDFVKRVGREVCLSTVGARVEGDTLDYEEKSPLTVAASNERSGDPDARRSRAPEL